VVRLVAGRPCSNWQGECVRRLTIVGLQRVVAVILLLWLLLSSPAPVLCVLLNACLS
jgi:hypothetical protein